MRGSGSVEDLNRGECNKKLSAAQVEQEDGPWSRVNLEPDQSEARKTLNDRSLTEVTWEYQKQVHTALVKLPLLLTFSVKFPNISWIFQ